MFDQARERIEPIIIDLKLDSWVTHELVYLAYSLAVINLKIVYLKIV